jgi:hypothetical protein
MFDQFRLNILTFPQRFDGGNLAMNFLILPQIGTQWSGNPLLQLPLGFPNAASMGSPFAQASLPLEARIISGLGQFPAHAPVDLTVALGTPATFPDAVALFTELQNQFQIKNAVAAAPSRKTPGQIRAFSLRRQRSPGAKCTRTACATRHWHATWG